MTSDTDSEPGPQAFIPPSPDERPSFNATPKHLKFDANGENTVDVLTAQMSQDVSGGAKRGTTSRPISQEDVAAAHAQLEAQLQRKIAIRESMQKVGVQADQITQLPKTSEELKDILAA